MKRDLGQLAGRKFDLIVVGGGIFGACLAWDASLRGLSVALLEKSDFGGETSANCFRIVHGGIRYLQHADLWRTREAIRERRVMLRIAPHLVKPLPIAVPTFKGGLLGRRFLQAGAFAYDLLSLDRNRGIEEASNRIPSSRTMNAAEFRNLFPEFENEAISGAVVIYDGIMKSAARLTLEFVQSAAEYGSQVANYVEVTDLACRNGRVTGIRARDALSGNEFDVLGTTVVNATGPWADAALRNWLGFGLPSAPKFSRDMCIVVARQFGPANMGIAFPAIDSDQSALISRGRRHLFMVPWGQSTAIGVWHKVDQEGPERFTVMQQELERVLGEVNDAIPSMGLGIEDLVRAQAGLVPIAESSSSTSGVEFGRRSLIADHAEIHGIEGLISVVGVRFTTARHVAQDVVDLVFRKSGYRPPECMTDKIPLIGGRPNGFGELKLEAERQFQRMELPIGSEIRHNLLRNYGSRYIDIAQLIDERPMLAHSLDGTGVTQAELVHAVQNEMAMTLPDLTLRRTDLCVAGHPGKHVLRLCAELMAREIGWDAVRTDRELAAADLAANGSSGISRKSEDLEVH